MVQKVKPKPGHPANGSRRQARPAGFINIIDDRKRLHLAEINPKREVKITSWLKVELLGRYVHISGVRTRVYSIQDIADMWKGQVTYAIAHRWYAQGLLPPPYFVRKLFNGIIQPLWIKPQVKAIHQILNYHWAKFGSLTSRHKITVRALYERCELCRDNFDRRIESNQRRKRVTRAGVEWVVKPRNLPAHIPLILPEDIPDDYE